MSWFPTKNLLVRQFNLHIRFTVKLKSSIDFMVVNENKLKVFFSNGDKIFFIHLIILTRRRRKSLFTKRKTIALLCNIVFLFMKSDSLSPFDLIHNVKPFLDCCCSYIIDMFISLSNLQSLLYDIFLCIYIDPFDSMTFRCFNAELQNEIFIVLSLYYAVAVVSTCKVHIFLVN